MRAPTFLAAVAVAVALTIATATSLAVSARATTGLDSLATTTSTEATLTTVAATTPATTSATVATVAATATLTAYQDPAVTISTEAEPPSRVLPSNQAYQSVSIPKKGGYLKLTFLPGDFLKVTCDLDADLEGALPALRPPSRVRSALFECAPPRAGYGATLARLGVTLAPAASLALALPPPGHGAPLDAHHLARLDLDKLTLRARKSGAPPPAPALGLLAGRRLRALEAPGVLLPADALAPPPEGLTSLWVESGRVPRAALAALTTLYATHAELEGAAPALRSLTLTLAAGEAAPAWARFPALRVLSLIAWSEPRPARWESCAELRSLTLSLARAEELPARWLGACAALQKLALSAASRLRSLPAALLERADGGPATALTELELRHGALAWLPATLFDPVPNLRHLDLTKNNLRTLPGGIFTKVINLEMLNLSKNEFTDSDVYLQVRMLRRLSVLNLSGNKRLGDACEGDAEGRRASGDSHLSPLTNLTSLELSGTAVTRICRDWREGMPHLLLLALQNTNITHLSFDDLQYRRARPERARVLLYNSRVRTIEYSAAEARRALEVPPAGVQVHLSEPLDCDCRLFRALRALRARPEHASLAGALVCAGPARVPLAAVPLDELLCESRGGACPAACACWEREQGAEGALTPAWRVRVACEGARLLAAPRLPDYPRADIEWDLRLANNHISTLDDLPEGLLKLDVRNNSVHRVTARAASVLRGAADVQLGGNPLECRECGAAPLLGVAGALYAARALGPARCRDGRALREAAAAPPPACGSAGGGAALLGSLGAALGALLLAAAGVGAALARPARRARLKGVLLRWGWLPRAPEPDEERRFDAFVSFAHADAEWTRALAARLEAGPRPLRLCLHERDWAPGEFIGAQIAASVRAARRTVVVVSRHFLRSEWARAEFREAAAAGARDATPRLLLVLREPPHALPLDRELRRYLRSNTYLRADHPRFWDLLREALPAPRPPPDPVSGPRPASAPTSAPASAPDLVPASAEAPDSSPLSALAPGALAAPIGVTARNISTNTPIDSSGDDSVSDSSSSAASSLSEESPAPGEDAAETARCGGGAVAARCGGAGAAAWRPPPPEPAPA